MGRIEQRRQMRIRLDEIEAVANSLIQEKIKEDPNYIIPDPVNKPGDGWPDVDPLNKKLNDELIFSNGILRAVSGSGYNDPPLTQEQGV